MSRLKLENPLLGFKGLSQAISLMILSGSLLLTTACSKPIKDDQTTTTPESSTATLVSSSTQVETTESKAEDKGKKLKTVEGETRPLGGGTVTSFAVLDKTGKPVSLGLRFTKSALEQLPQNCSSDKIHEGSFWEFCFGGKMNDALITIFKAPAEAAMTNVATLELSWLPYGHAPEGIWDKPQFDIHFNFVAPTGGTDDSKIYVNPDEGELPEGYQILPGSGFPWDTPAQKFHSHSAAPADSPEFNGGKFTTNFLYITYDGQVIGYEPYVALDHLKGLTSLESVPIKKPDHYPRDGFYPSSMQVGFDAKTDSYIIAIEGFEEYKSK